LVPDALWEIVEPLIPRFVARPQGGGSAPADDRAVFTAIVFVLTSGCAWRHLPPSFGVTVPTAHRRFMYLGDLSQSDLDAIAAKLNNRPRKCLGFRTPAEFMADEAVALTG
jgi:transposase